jgi:predicted nucleic acid-binding protein
MCWCDSTRVRIREQDHDTLVMSSGLAPTVQYLLDTNVFNWLVQGDLSIADLPSNGAFVATPVQRGELDKTPDQTKRGALLALFSTIVTDLHPAPFAFDVQGAGFDQGRWTDGILANALRNDLDRKQKKPNNIEDALIAETAITYGFILVTSDRNLRAVAESHGCRVMLLSKK